MIKLTEKQGRFLLAVPGMRDQMLINRFKDIPDEYFYCGDDPKDMYARLRYLD